MQEADDIGEGTLDQPGWWRRFTRPLRSTSADLTIANPRVPDNCRIYAVGDIHGQTALFKALLDRIEADNADRPAMHGLVIILGDFIDRGGGAAALLRGLAQGLSSKHALVLKGNHEASMVAAWNGNAAAMRGWLSFGGGATLGGFGVEADEIDPEDPERMVELVRSVIPRDLIEWAHRLPVHSRIGDYFFVHAGIRPGVKLARQRADDLLWIRDEFLMSDRHHGAMIVHGHTVEEDGPVITPNRIGVDTGAYRTGRLSAVALEGDQRWTIEVDDPGLILPGLQLHASIAEPIAG